MAKTENELLIRTTSGDSRHAGFTALPWRIWDNLGITGFDAGVLERMLPDERLKSAIRDARALSVPCESEGLPCGTLPNEFSVRELIDLDPTDDSALLAFMENYGVAVSPWLDSDLMLHRYQSAIQQVQVWERFGEEGLDEHLLVLWQRVVDERSTASAEPDGFRRMLGEVAWLSEAMRASRVLSRGKEKIVASWDEAALVLRLLRESAALLAALDIAEGALPKAVKAMMHMGVAPYWVLGGHSVGEWSGRGRPWVVSLSQEQRESAVNDIATNLLAWKAIENAEIFLNAFLSAGGVAYGGFRTYRSARSHEYGCKPNEQSASALAVKHPAETLLGRYGSKGLAEGSLGTAVALDLIETMRSATVWRRCCNSKCMRYFKHCRSDPSSVSRKRDRGALFCTDACRKAHRRWQIEVAAEELAKRIDQNRMLLKDRSLVEREAWVKNAIVELNLTPEYMAMRDRKRYRESGYDTAFVPSRPTLTSAHAAKALELLQRQS